MIIHMRHTLWTGISETNVNIITSATRTHAFNNNNNIEPSNRTRDTIKQPCYEGSVFNLGLHRYNAIKIATSVKGPNMWNDIPTDIKVCKSMFTFKKM